MEDVSPHNVSKARTDLLFSTTIFGAGMSVIGIAVICWALWCPVMETGLVAWFAALVILFFFRVGVWLAYRRGPVEQPLRWAWIITALVGTTGLVWGFGVAWIFHIGTDHDIMIVTCIALGALMMATPTICFWPTHFAFQTAMMTPATVGLLTSGQPGHMQLSVASLALFVFQAIAGRKLGQRLVASLDMAVRNADLARSLSEHGQALEYANRRLEVMSRTDELTGLANRRWFLESIERKWRSVEEGRLLALLAIDVDHFKHYNDRFGHGAGDDCLRVVAIAIGQRARGRDDLAARPGGEEFALLIDVDSLGEAIEIAEQVRREVGEATRVAKLPAATTISVGVRACAPGRGGSAGALISDADRALYRAKKAGRDRVAVDYGGANAGEAGLRREGRAAG